MAHNRVRPVDRSGEHLDEVGVNSGLDVLQGELSRQAGKACAAKERLLLPQLKTSTTSTSNTHIRRHEKNRHKLRTAMKRFSRNYEYHTAVDEALFFLSTGAVCYDKTDSCGGLLVDLLLSITRS